MTIEKGSPYGEPGSVPDDGVTVDSDRAARGELEAALEGLDPERRAEILVELAMACHWLLDVPSTRAYAGQALELAESLGREDLAAGAIGALAFADGVVPAVLAAGRVGVRKCFAATIGPAWTFEIPPLRPAMLR